MSRSAIPSAFRAVMTAVIEAAFASRASLTVFAVVVTPRRRSAMSGVRTTRPGDDRDEQAGRDAGGRPADPRSGHRDRDGDRGGGHRRLPGPAANIRAV